MSNKIKMHLNRRECERKDKTEFLKERLRGGLSRNIGAMLKKDKGWRPLPPFILLDSLLDTDGDLEKPQSKTISTSNS